MSTPSTGMSESYRMSLFFLSFGAIAGRIAYARFGKSFFAQQAAVATATGQPLDRGIVAAVRNRIIDSQIDADF